MDIEPTLQRLSREPDLWVHLKTSGFFLINFSDGFRLDSQPLLDLGYSSEDLSEDRFPEHIHPDDESLYRKLWERVAQGGDSVFDAEYRIRDRKTMEWCWIQSHGVVLARDGANIAVYAGMDPNITARKASEAFVRQQLSEIEMVFHQSESLRVASMLAHSSLDLDKTIQLVLNQAHSLLPFHKAAVSLFRDGGFEELGSTADPGEPPGIPGKAPSHPVWTVVADGSPALHDDLGGLEPAFWDDPAKYRSWLGIPLIVRNQLLGVLEFWHREPGFFRSEQIWPAMGFADSVAESLSNSQKYEALKEDAHTDPLTGLFTRRYLQTTGPELLDASFRDQRPLAILLLDIDHFKEINDQHGHLAGDTVLMKMAQLCRSLLRKGDLFFRFGGEEFIAILPDTQAEVARRIAERLREVIAASRFGDLGQGITLSIGVAPIAVNHQVSFDEAVDEADQAMYQAKGNGRNQVILSDRWIGSAS